MRWWYSQTAKSACIESRLSALGENDARDDVAQVATAAIGMAVWLFIVWARIGEVYLP
jgi:hypothetical protein